MARVAPYIVVQYFGGVAGTMVAHLMFELPPLMIGIEGREGPSQVFAEAVATFTLLLTVFGGLRYAAAAVPGWSGSPSPRPIGSPPRPRLPIRR